MQSRSPVQIVSAAALLVLFASAPLSAAGNTEPAPAGRPDTSTSHSALAPGRRIPGFAVVELFTSSGCSSCPPAERALTELTDQAAAAGRPVYSLAWHVDYWNQLGWLDPYSSRQATNRQKQYAEALSSGLYTPEAVVNGTTVASYAGDTSELNRLVDTLLARPARSAVTLATSVDPKRHRIRVRADAAPAANDSAILLVLVESGLVQHPTAGENAGKTLRESGVVRGYARLPAKGGTAELPIPEGMKLSAARVVALVQDESTHVIVGANESAPLSSVPRDATTVRGSVVTETGAGSEGVLIQACSDTLCIPGKSDARGRFSLPRVPSGQYTIKFYPAGTASGSMFSLPLVAEADEQITLPTIAVGR